MTEPIPIREQLRDIEDKFRLSSTGEVELTCIREVSTVARWLIDGIEYLAGHMECELNVVNDMGIRGCAHCMLEGLLKGET